MTNSSLFPQGAALSAQESLLYKSETRANKANEEVAATVEAVGDLLRYTFWHFTNNEWRGIFVQDLTETTADWATLYAFLEQVAETEAYENWVNEGTDTDAQHRSIGLLMLKTQIHNALTGN